MPPKPHFVLYDGKLLRRRDDLLPCNICGDLPGSEEYDLGQCCGSPIQIQPEPISKTISYYKAQQRILARAKELDW